MRLVGDEYPLVWDGSHLGQYPEEIMIERYDLFPYDLYRLHNPFNQGGSILCAMHSSKSKYPCIVDECKFVLGMSKIGTHSITIGRTLYIMYNIQYPPTLLRDVPPDIKCNDNFKRMVQDVYVFRLVFGLGCNFDSSIIVLNGIPSSYRNNLDISCEKGFEISDKALDEWFIDTIGHSMKRMIYISGRTNFMRWNIQKVINRIDKDLIWIDNQIIDRMLRLE
jgi:hypothetical protein